MAHLFIKCPSVGSHRHSLKHYKVWCFALGYPLEPDDKTPLLKTPCTWVTGLGEIKLVASWLLHSCWLACILPEMLCVPSGEQPSTSVSILYPLVHCALFYWKWILFSYNISWLQFCSSILPPPPPPAPPRQLPSIWGHSIFVSR